MATFSLSPVPFSGSDYVPERDAARLTRQIDRIADIVLDGEWRTIDRIVAILRKRYPKDRFPENSVQAQLRNLRKIGYTVQLHNVAAGLYEYRVFPPVNPGVGAVRRGGVSLG